MDLVVVVFAVVYAGMIFGRLPGLRLDRTAIALVGAVTLVAAGRLTPVDAWRAIDVGTIGLLFGLMLVSAQFRQSGFYSAITRALAARPTTPERLLLELILLVGLLSALLTNDVVCLAIAPVLIDVCVRRGLDPVPFLLGLAAGSNVGSAATLIGNPQNMLIGQALHLQFAPYLLDGGVPAGLGLLATWWLLQRAYRGRFVRELMLDPLPEQHWDGPRTWKAIAVLTLLLLTFLFTSVPREVAALAAGALLLVSRRQSSQALLAQIDWALLLLFAGLFVTNEALRQSGDAARGFAAASALGLDVGKPVALFVAAVVGSNVISNVPLTVLLLPAVSHPWSGPILALATTLAGNLLLVGSIANLIVVEQANRLGVVPVGGWGRAHARTGVPITLVTLAIAGLWLWLRGAGS
jgi:Na+/H+ antiporter NhaD/arsenite permease-like protein